MKNTALITGASNGIGLELAKVHASKGGDLVLVARNKSKLDELKTELEKQFKVSVYTSMIKGKSVAIHGIMNYIMANSIRFIPRSMVLKVSRKLLDKA